MVSYRFSMGFLWVFYCFLWDFYGFSIVFYGVSMGFLLFSMGFYGFSIVFYGVSMGFLLFSMGFYGFSASNRYHISKFYKQKQRVSQSSDIKRRYFSHKYEHGDPRKRHGAPVNSRMSGMCCDETICPI